MCGGSGIERSIYDDDGAGPSIDELMRNPRAVLGHIDSVTSDEHGVEAKVTLNEAGRELLDRLERASRVPRDDPERFNWQEWIGEWNHEELTVAQEFEWLRANPKWSTAQAQRVKHLEEHLDAGDVLCKCYRDGE